MTEKELEKKKKDAVNMMVISNVLSSTWTETVRGYYTKNYTLKPKSNQFFNKLKCKIDSDNNFLKYLDENIWSEENDKQHEAICRFSEMILKITRLHEDDVLLIENMINKLVEQYNNENNDSR